MRLFGHMTPGPAQGILRTCRIESHGGQHMAARLRSGRAGRAVGDRDEWLKRLHRRLRINLTKRQIDDVRKNALLISIDFRIKRPQTIEKILPEVLTKP